MIFFLLRYNKKSNYKLLSTCNEVLSFRYLTALISRSIICCR